MISRARYSPPINNENCAEPCDAFRQPCFGTMSTVLPRLNSSPMPIIRRLLTRRSCLCCLRCVRHSLHSDAEATVSTPSNIGVCPCTSKLCPATTLLTVRYTPCRPPSPSSISLDPHAPGSIYNLFVDIRTYIYIRLYIQHYALFSSYPGRSAGPAILSARSIYHTFPTSQHQAHLYRRHQHRHRPSR